jgi:hypothetical protein
LTFPPAAIRRYSRRAKENLIMRRTWIVLAAAALGIVGCANMGHHGSDEKSEAKKIKDADVPALVRDSVNKRFPGASVTSVEREKENGMVVFDYELKQNGRKWETDVKDDGTIMEVEKQLQGGEIPSSIQTAVSSKYPRATITEVMEVNKVSNGQEKADHYEATITPADGKEKEVNVTLDGKLQEGQKE